MGACENYFCHKWQLETLTISLAFGNICGELSGSFPIPSIPTNLVPTYLVTVLNEKLNQAEFIPLFWFWALHFFTINTKHIFPHCFFISWYMFYLFLWVLDFYYEYWKENHKCQTFLSVFEVQGWQSYTDVDFMLMIYVAGF